MFRLTAVLALVASVAAFAPVGRVARSSSLKMGFESEIGAQPPLGFWDPLGLLADADQERFDRLRYVEVKHGIENDEVVYVLPSEGLIKYQQKFSERVKGRFG